MGVPLAERALDGAAEMAQVDGLDQVVEGAALHAEGRAGGVVHRRQHQDGHVRLELQNPRHQLDAVDPRQIHVQQHAGDLLAPDHLEGLFSRSRERHLVPLEHEVLPHRVADGLLVIHDEQGHGCCVHGHVPSPGQSGRK
jgi:hypothetical protein